MHPRVVRFPAQQMDLITRMAELEGLTVSAYIRNAAFGRAFFDAVFMRDFDDPLMQDLIEASPHLAQFLPDPGPDPGAGD